MGAVRRCYVQHFNRLADALRHGGRLGRWHVAQVDGEFLATQPPAQIIAANGGAQAVRDCLEHAIAHGMAIAVIDRLEMIDIDQQAGAGLAVLLLLQPTQKGRPVEQAGHLVHFRQLPQFHQRGAQLVIETALLLRLPVHDDTDGRGNA